MFNSYYKMIFFAGVLLGTIIRKIYTSKYRKMEVKSDFKTLMDIVLLVFAGIGMMVPLVYVFSSVLDFADYKAPVWLTVTGSSLFCGFLWLLWRSHSELGKYWTVTLQLREDHILIKTGIYKHIRHPMYAAHMLWAIAQAMILPNWIAGFSFLATFPFQYLYRVEKEEEMMLKQFGDQYRQYMNETGRIFPRLFFRR